MTDPDSGNDLPRRVAQGTESAKEEVYRRYHQGLVAFVQRELGSRGARVSAESVAMSAWGSFLRGVAGQRYQFDHSGALWRLLTTIARRKVYDTAPKGKNLNVDLDADLLAGRDPDASGGGRRGRHDREGPRGPATSVRQGARTFAKRV